jgi:Tfp pilus assembly protein PilP
LEKIPLSEIEILGVMTGPKKARAMLKVKNKDKTYFVTKGVKLGDREGEIIKVTTKSVTVREKVINPLGETETLDTEILMKENKK